MGAGAGGSVEINGGLPAGITAATVYYSTSKNPQRDELTTGVPASGEPPNWSATPPADITTVKSLKFELTGTLSPSENLTLSGRCEPPLNAPTSGEIAWNSFGYTAKRADNDSQLLASEPVKVGITTKASSPAYYGDYVWYDTDRDGIQDASESGINGVRVELYEPAGASPHRTPTRCIRYGHSERWHRRRCLLVFQPATGDYYAVFYPPSGMTASPLDAGGMTAPTPTALPEPWERRPFMSRRLQPSGRRRMIGPGTRDSTILPLVSRLVTGCGATPMKTVSRTQANPEFPA